MQFDDGVQDFLRGDRFSESLLVRWRGSDCDTLNRNAFLARLCEGKKVLHVGFADHLEILQTKFDSGQWLHAKLVAGAARCVGLDTNRKAVEYCSSHLDAGEVFVHDVVRDVPLEALRNSRWDFAVFGDVLEHVDNPGEFLKAFRERYRVCVERIVVTVPNAWALENFFNAIRGAEFINSDHRFWFTPFTLAKVAAGAGYEVESMYFTGVPRHQRWPSRWIRSRYPALRETLIGIFV